MKKHLAMTAAVGAAALIGGVIVCSVARAGDDDRSGERMSAYKQTNLVSSIPGLARTTDPNLKNPWGVAFVPGGALWVSDNATKKSTLYNGQGDILPPGNPLVVDVPDSPTGIVANSNPGDFPTDPNNPRSGAIFLFAGEGGTITGWNPAVTGPTMARVLHNSGPNTVYKGLAWGNTDAGNFLFAANFSGAAVEVYDANFKEISGGGKHGKMFHDPKLPRGYAPFGIHNVTGNLVVTFAKQSEKNKGEEQTGPGLGIVDVFSTEGELIKRLVTNGPLNAPWGVARAPMDFGKFSNAILIGNFGDGRINAFDNNGKFLGELRKEDGKPIVIEGLWALAFGTFQKSGPDDLYFTAGIKDEKEGLFGEIALVGRHGGHRD